MAKVRLADIAKVAGVSAVTVHNAITGQKGVSDEMRTRILELAKEMGYRQPGSGPKDAQGKSLRCIGVLIPERYLAEYTTFYWKMYQEMALAATEKSCMVTVEILKQEMEDGRIVPSIAKEQTVDALILMGDTSRDYIRYLKKQVDLPIIFLDFYDDELAKDAVIADNFHGMYLMTDYLYKRGFSKLAFVGSIHSSSSIMDRYCGFLKAVLEHRDVTPPEWVLEDRDEHGQIEIRLPEQMPEAFVCNCDLTAGLLILELKKRGFSVPEDVSIVGFDNYLYPGFPDLKITSYEINTKAMVRVALEKALKQIRSAASGKNMEIVAGQIVEKESVKA